MECWERLEDPGHGKLLKLLTLEGAIVTTDVLNCQRAIAEQIVEQKGDYALALKAN